MKKQMFIASIKALQLQYDRDIKNAKLMAQIFPEASSANTLYPNHYLFNQLVAIIQEQMNDDNSESWIEYFMNELDFGRKYKPGCATEENGTHIDIATPEKLYDYLYLINNTL